MKKIMNTMGDSITSLHPEDWARLQSDPRFANLVGVMSSISSNMEMNLPYEFLKKHSGENVEHLKDFYMLSRTVSAYTFIADGLRSRLADRTKDRTKDCDAIKEECTQKLTALREEIKNKLDSGIPETSPEIKELRNREEALKSEQDAPHIALMDREVKNVEEFRKKQFTDEFDEEKTGNIYELNKESFSETLGLTGLRELEMLKNSSYWEYKKTGEQEKQDYTKSLKSRGLSESYDMEAAKKICLKKMGDTIKTLATLQLQADEYGLKTDAIEENMEALAKTLRSFGYTDKELSKFLSDTYKKAASAIERYEQEKEELKKKGKEMSIGDISSYEQEKEKLPLIDDLAGRLKVEFEKE